MSTHQSFTVENSDWLTPLYKMWKYYGRKGEFEIIRSDWPSEYFDLLKRVDPELIEVYPNSDYKDENGQVGSMMVHVKPKGLELLQRPRQVHRQLTIDGKRVDLRSERAHIILTAAVESLTALAPIWIEQLNIEPEHGPRRAMRLQLERLLAYRGPELPLTLRDQIITALMNHNKKVDGCQCQKTAEM